MPYWLFFKKRQNLKLSSAANYRWRLLNIDNPYLEQMVSQIYPTELLNKNDSFDTEVPF